MTKYIPLTGLSIMYAPRGPVHNPHDSETLKAIINKVSMEAKKHRAIFLRIDPNIPEKDLSNLGNGDPFVNEGFVHLSSRWSMWNAPRDVYRTNLTKAEDEQQLFRLIKKNARKGIRKSGKDGVKIRQGTSLKDLAAFYGIFRQFADEKGFLCRSYSYQERIWREFISTGRGILFLSIYNGEVAGGQICLRFGPLCVGMHRGVLYEYHEHRINEALVWEGMKWAKKHGCIWYCQRGAGSSSLSKFKEKFSADLISLVGYYDLPFRPAAYLVFHVVESRILPIFVNLLVRHLRGLREVWSRMPYRRQ